MKNHVKQFTAAADLVIQLLMLSALSFYYADACDGIFPQRFCATSNYDHRLYAAGYKEDEVVYIKTGETKRIKLNVYLQHNKSLPPPKKLFSLTTDQEEALARGDNTLIVWANGQASVSWDGVLFDRENAYLTINATKDAKELAPDDYIDQPRQVYDHVHLQDLGHRYLDGYPVALYLQIKEDE